MQYKITNAVKNDLPIIYNLFENAIQYMKTNKYIGWNSYDKDFIQSDIEQGLLWKITNNHEIACIFSVCYSDEMIWREKEKGNAIYLHRIVLNRNYTGEKLFNKVLEWTIQFAKNKKLKYIRMDTWANNQKLIDYYKSYGFSFIENYTTLNTEKLPLQHRNLHVALLELSIGTN